MSPSTQREQQNLVEQALSAWRPQDRDGGIRAHPAWADLDEAGRIEVFQQTLVQRAIEAALDSQGLSSTAHAVLDRIRRPRD